MKKFVIMLSAILLVGCQVTNLEIGRAQKLCETHEGIKYIDSSGGVRCNNGVFFYTD